MFDAVTHVAPGQHQTFRPRPGVVFQVLHTGPSWRVILHELEPGTQYECPPHLGEELRFVLTGEVIFEIGGQDYRTPAGGSVRHTSSVSHGFRTEAHAATFITFALSYGHDLAALFRGAGAGEAQR
jgi:quercetin dioxygenase-like cupin family protein